MQLSRPANKKPVNLITRENNFDLLRLLFAFVVLLVHMATLTKSADLYFLKSYLSAEVAVDCFFVISGFLIVRSFESSITIQSYFLKRLSRVYPAYVAVIVLSVILGFFITSGDLKSYWSYATIKYLLANLLFLNFLQPDLPGAFDGNPFNAVNGALWTIKIEVAFYLSVPFIVKAVSRFGVLKVLGAIYVLSAGYFYLFEYFAELYNSGFMKQLGRQFPAQLRFFVSGALMYYFLPLFHENRWAIFCLTLLFFFIPSMGFIYPLSLSVMVISAALFLPQLVSLSKFGDYSYGLYVLHFPIIQTLVHFGVFNNDPYLFAISTIILTFFLAGVSWNFIEKPFVEQLRNKYVA